MTTADISVGAVHAEWKKGFSAGYFRALGALVAFEGGSTSVKEILHAYGVKKDQAVDDLKADLLAKGATEYDAEDISAACGYKTI